MAAEDLARWSFCWSLYGPSTKRPGLEHLLDVFLQSLGVKFLVGRTLGFLKGMVSESGYVIGFPDPLSRKTTCWNSWRRRFGHFILKWFKITKAWILRFVCKNVFVSFRSEISIKRGSSFFFGAFRPIFRVKCNPWKTSLAARSQVDETKHRHHNSPHFWRKSLGCKKNWTFQLLTRDHCPRFVPPKGG